MCEAWLLCKDAAARTVVHDAEALADLERTELTLYRFKTKDFWGQIATIWNWFIRILNPVTSETRPAIVFQMAPSGTNDWRQTQAEVAASLDLQPAVISIDGTNIDRLEGTWTASDGAALGHCARTPIRDALAFIDPFGIWPIIDQVPRAKSNE